MTAQATILNIWCVRSATGTDIGANEAIAGLVTTMPLDGLGVPGLQDAVKAVPGVIAAIDSARNDPDNFYVTTDTVGKLENSVWPTDRPTQDMLADQSVSPHLPLGVDYSQNVSLWDYDTISDDDLLGSVTIYEQEQGQGEIAKLASSSVESSAYYVTYRVD